MRVIARTLVLASVAVVVGTLQIVTQGPSLPGSFHDLGQREQEARLAESIRVLAGWQLSGCEILVELRRGGIMLYGVVRSEEQKDLATKVMRSIFPDMRIENRMIVAASAPAALPAVSFSQWLDGLKAVDRRSR